MSKNAKYLILLWLATAVLVGCESYGGSGEVQLPQVENPVPIGQTTNSESIENDLYENAEPINLTLGNFTVTEGIESFYGFPGNPADLITLETAADIGANFILDVLNHDLEGLYLLMEMQHNPWINRNSWIGIVTPFATYSTDSMENFDDQLFSFLIDAVTGERYNVSDNTPNAWLRENSGSRDLSETELLALFPVPTADEITQLEAIAHDVARRFFLGSRVQDVGISLMFGNGGGSPLANFWATDDAGRQIEIAIIRETGQVWFITNPDSLIPGN